MSAPKLELHPCHPPSWAKTGHAQTILGHLLPSAPRLPEGSYVHIPLPDGDTLVAKFLKGKSDTVVYAFHGLCGNISANYMTRTAALALSLGHSVYLVNHRGCGEGSALARLPYHSGRGEDVSEVLAFGRKKHKGAKQIAVGFSLGGNALLNLLTGLRGSSLPDGAIAVNAPIDLASCAVSLEKGLNRIYDFVFVSELTSDIKLKSRRGQVQFGRFPKRLTLRGFDSLYTAPKGGFQTREHYYETCSTYLHLSKIQVPTLILTADDDPFVLSSAYKNARLPSSVKLHIEPVGGHMGYLAKGTKFGPKRWLDYALSEGLKALA